tara:strand:- start:65 stop:778 length:714 start_codon:yes stop_codon:yes gene_type:complete
MAFLQFAGRYENPITNAGSGGWNTFGVWEQNGAAGAYNASTTIKILTPNFPDIDGNALNNEPAGQWLQGETNRQRGFAAYASNDSGDMPVNNAKNLLSIGVLNEVQYEVANGTDWSPFTLIPQGFYAYDETTQSAYPGNSDPVANEYTLIFLSNIYRGQPIKDQNCKRVIYKADIGSLGAVVARLVNTGGSGGGNATPSFFNVNAGTVDESAGGQLMAAGYGLLKQGQLIFAEQIAE